MEGKEKAVNILVDTLVRQLAGKSFVLFDNNREIFCLALS